MDLQNWGQTKGKGKCWGGVQNFLGAECNWPQSAHSWGWGQRGEASESSEVLAYLWMKNEISGKVHYLFFSINPTPNWPYLEGGGGQVGSKDKI